MTGDRAVSDTLAFTLVFAIIITSVGFTGLYGVDAVESIRDGAQANTAEQSMNGYAAGVARIRDDRAPQHVQRLELNGDHLQTADSELRVEIEYDDGSTEDETIQVGTFERRTAGDTRFVYTSGATFRVQRGGAVVTGEPALRCGSDTAHASLVTVDGRVSQSSDRSVTVRTTARDRMAITPLDPDGDVASVTIDVRNTRYDEAWERLFESELTDWSGNDGEYTCSGIDRAIVHNTTVETTVD
jgi:hypothetical protein